PLGRGWSDAHAGCRPAYTTANAAPSLLAGEALRRYSEREGDLAQLRLDRASVLGAHAQQLLLRRGQALRARVRGGVANSSVRLQARRTAADRRLEQRHDGALERAVE